MRAEYLVRLVFDETEESDAAGIRCSRVSDAEGFRCGGVSGADGFDAAGTLPALNSLRLVQIMSQLNM